MNLNLRNTKKIIFYIALVVLVILLLEGITGILWAVKTQTFNTPTELFNSQVIVKEVGRKSDKSCSWGDTVQPHPHFGHNYTSNSECSEEPKNEWGLLGNPIGLEKNPEYFNILVLGGSVAEIFSTRENRVNFEILLNQRFRPPKGKSFRLLNGAMSGTSHPVQMASLLVLNQLADAVISIEGFNELSRFQLGLNLYEPHAMWKEIRAHYNRGIKRASWDMLKQSLAVDISRSIFKNSFLAFTLARLLVHQNKSDAASIYPGFPSAYSIKEVHREIKKQYQNSLLAIAATAKVLKLPFAVFAQPVPGLFKTLTTQEREVAMEMSYYQHYKVVIETLLSLRSQGVAAFDLSKIFKNSTETIYVDHVHLNDEGNKIMGEAIANSLEKAWSLTRK